MSTVEYDLKNNKAKIKSIDSKGKVNFDKEVNLKSSNSQNAAQVSIAGTGPYTRIASGSDSYWGHVYNIYKYTNGSGYWWGITKSGNTKVPDETSSNSSDLYGFKDAVDTASTNTISAAAAVGASATAAVIGILSAAPTVGMGTVIAALAAVGALLSAAGFFYSAWVASRDANYHFDRV